jgi:DNA-binding transcriptional LysR family regulator
MDELETRELRYFVAVAEELHFGRAAARLGMAQPPLSRAIRLLERRIGVPLLERTSRSVRLTPAGEVLLREGREALAAMGAATRRARRAGRTEPRLVLAMKPGGDAGLVQAILEEYATEPDAVPVDLAFSVGERAAMVRDGRADVALLHRPQNDLTGLDAEDLCIQHQVAVLPAAHPLARRAELRMADLAGEPMPRWPEGRDTGEVATRRPVRDGGEMMQLITLGRMVAVLPESVCDRLPKGVVCRPVADAQTATTVVAWPLDSRSRQVAAFVRAAATAARTTFRPPVTPG